MTPRTVPAAPFAEWMRAQVERDGSRLITARRLGTTERTVHRYVNQRRGTKSSVDVPAEAYPTRVVDHFLDRAGLGLTDLYPGIHDDIELEPDEWCPKCGETTTPIKGVCPWCETRVAQRMAA